MRKLCHGMLRRWHTGGKRTETFSGSQNGHLAEQSSVLTFKEKTVIKNIDIIISALVRII